MRKYTITKITPPKEITKLSVAEYLAEVARVVYNRKEPSSKPLNLLQRLMKESYGDTPSNLLSFVPCTLPAYIEGLRLDRGKLFGYFFGGMYRTSLRELLIPLDGIEEWLKYIDFDKYEVYHAEVPYFIYQQIRTHTQIQFVSHSARFTDVNLGYWYPEEWVSYFDDVVNERKTDKRLIIEYGTEDAWSHFVENNSPADLERFMREVLQVKDRGVYSRGIDMLRIRPFTIGLDTVSPYAYQHFVNERTTKHTQTQTREFVEQLKEMTK